MPDGNITNTPALSSHVLMSGRGVLFDGSVITTLTEPFLGYCEGFFV